VKTTELTPAQLAAFIDLALLKPDASVAQIEQLCVEAREYLFFSVCVNGAWVAAARHFLDGSDVKVVSTVGFPLGAMAGDVKRYETEVAMDDGAHEIDMVLNIARLKAGDDKFIFREIVDVVEAADERPVKVIIETCLLTDAEKVRACQLIVESGAQFVKTSTGFSTAGATVADVKLLRDAVGEKFGVKASGGIRDAQTALAMIAAGATRLGTSSGIAILKGLADGGTN
jgi:deoxyribose-phosphate aldolase